MNRRTVAVVFITSMLVLSLHAFLHDAATSAAAKPKSQVTILFGKDGIWKDLEGSEKNLQGTLKIGSTVTIPAGFHMWHSSTGYWEADGKQIEDKDIEPNYANFNDLMRGQTEAFNIPFPGEVREKINSGNNVIVAVSAGYGLYSKQRLDIDRMFHTETGHTEAEYSVSSDQLTIKLPIKFNFMRQNKDDQTSEIITLQKSSEDIAAKSGNGNVIWQYENDLPVPEFGYGGLLGAIWGRKGGDLGGHAIKYYDEDRFLYSAPYTVPPSNPDSPWWLGHLRMNGTDAVLDPVFDKEIVHDPNYHSENISVGSGTFTSKGAVGAMFYFPLEIEFYLSEDDNLSASSENDISSANPGEAVNLVFAASSTFLEEVKTNYIITCNGAKIDAKQLSIPAFGENEVLFRFKMPSNNVKVIFTVNPDNNPEEARADDNKVELTVLAASTIPADGDITLDYNVLTREETFNLGATTAILQLPAKNSATWTGPAVGTLTVTNRTPDIYHDFRVDGIQRNTAEIPVEYSGEIVTVNPRIQTTIVRDWDKFNDDPLTGNYGEADTQDIGVIEAEGSVKRPYSYRARVSSGYYNEKGKWVDTSYWTTKYSSVTASFCSVNNEKEITVKVYNGKEPITPASVLKEQIDGNTADSHSKHLWWESEGIMLTVLRPMGDMKPRFIEREPPPVTGRYERVFTNQNEARITWSIASVPGKGLSNMGNEYKADRNKSKSRDYKTNGEEKAVFASDIRYKNIGEYPIRSGYFLNPTGTYTFTITTEIYKDVPYGTQEHEQIADALIASFRYESNMIYIDSTKQAVTIGGDAATKIAGGTAYQAATGYATADNSPLFEISAEKDYKLEKVEEVKHAYSESGTDSRYKRVLEGYDESGTRSSKNNYRYVEYVQGDERVYKITETTKVTITVNPDNNKVYTHPQMKNGNYTVKAYFANESLNSAQLSSLKYSSYLTGQTLNGIQELDKIDIKVVGSIYDDIE